MKYGDKIANLRKENNMTQEQFAEVLGVSRQSVSKWESCRAFPETEKLIKISSLFSCSVDYLLKDEIDNKESNLSVENNEENKNYFLGVVLTYLSFPPLFGFIVGIFSIKHQLKNMHNKRMITLSIMGIIISLIFTAFMMIGFIFQL